MKEEILSQIIQSVKKTRETNPLAPSITNFVTINLVANAQLAVGGSAAMVFLPNEAENISKIGGATYINVGTLMPSHKKTMIHAGNVLHKENIPWVLDPVAVGIGEERNEILKSFKENKPSIIRGNSSEIIALAGHWELEGGVDVSNVRGVDSTDPVERAKSAAISLAKWTNGAVAVSGEKDLVTDGKIIAISKGGSHYMEKITGAGCSLAGVMAVYACNSTPFVAALTGTNIFNLAGKRAEEKAKGPGSFEVEFLDALYNATPEEIANNEFTIEEIK